MTKRYPALERRRNRIEERSRLVQIGKLLDRIEPSPVRKICIVCQKKEQIKNKRCEACQSS